MAYSLQDNGDTAPWLNVPENDVMSIEHPCIVRNIEKGISMLGGAQQIAQSIEQTTHQSLSLKFNPDDPAGRTVLSFHNDTSNLLLKVTVPKRTGRKRKRGSSSGFVDDDTTADLIGTDRASCLLLRSLKDNPQTSNVEVVGNIKSCHVWRAIPDFVYHTKASSFLQGVENHVLPQEYPRLKQWSIPRTYGLEDTEIVPPPVFSTQSLPHSYVYRQNPAVTAVADPHTGDKVLRNRAAAVKLHIQSKMFDDATYPSASSADCPPLEEQTKQVQGLVEELQKLFDRRPIWTRRALTNSLPPDANIALVRVAAAYVCYSLRSGPWRDAYCRLGIDPRTDPQYRIYQTILLQLHPRDKAMLHDRGPVLRLWERSPDPESHIFTGAKRVLSDGKTWQLCDLQDPTLKSLVNIPELHIRAQCETRYFGWYENGTVAKLRVLLKAKVDALEEDATLDSATVNSFLNFPEKWTPATNANIPTTATRGPQSERPTSKELEWAAAYRSICRTSGGALPNYGSSGLGRRSKPKPTMRPSFIDVDVHQDVDVDNTVDAGQETERDAEAAVGYQEPEDDDDDLLAGEQGDETVGLAADDDDDGDDDDNDNDNDDDDDDNEGDDA